MSICNCDYCGDLKDLDWTEGEWDIKDVDGNHYDFVCLDCFCDSEDFIDEESLIEAHQSNEAAECDHYEAKRRGEL